MIGKCESNTIIILDSCPLPVEGSETRVVADDAQTHMIELLESLNIKANESFIGWYVDFALVIINLQKKIF